MRGQPTSSSARKKESEQTAVFQKSDNKAEHKRLLQPQRLGARGSLQFVRTSAVGWYTMMCKLAPAARVLLVVVQLQAISTRVLAPCTRVQMSLGNS